MKPKVLHFKSNYLNLSETFIDRIVKNHKLLDPVVATCKIDHYTEDLTIFEMPQSGINSLINNFQLALNKSPSFLYKVIEKEKPDIIHGHFGLDTYRLLDVANTYKLP